MGIKMLTGPAQPKTKFLSFMVVIEAQACGLPAIVSDKGGPKEIVKNGQTGFIVSTSSVLAWQDEVELLIHLNQEHPERFQAMKEEARRNALQRSDWGGVLNEITGENIDLESETPAFSPQQEQANLFC